VKKLYTHSWRLQISGRGWYDSDESLLSDVLDYKIELESGFIALTPLVHAWLINIL
jgi:hypothetical protein